jgi:hypothetical protein
MLNIETIVVTEDCRRLTGYSPKAAFLWCKENNGSLFYRCKELKLEVKTIFIGGTIIEMRVKHNRKVVDEAYDIPGWNEFCYAIGIF